MKIIRFFSVAAMFLGLAGCATSPVVLAPVGPNPVGRESVASMGALQVFSRVVERSDDQNQGGDGTSGWPQHADYVIYNLHGKRVKHVGNTVGHYATAPLIVTLPPGRYIVAAEAEGALRVRVPVKIERGRISRIHLDGYWKPPASARRDELVSMPAGSFVGWRAGAGNEVGFQ
ncbi:MAG: hypothetical protein ABSH38_05845 [Verrucomicrobiota bacterium]|jgi:hypothetical protein